MGAKHTTQSVTPDDVKNFLSEYNVEKRLYPGSGRMMRTFRLTPRESNDKTEVVAKVMWTTTSSSDEEDVMKEQLMELEHIRDALKDTNHVAPFILWKMGNVQPTSSQRLVALIRPFTYTTLSDRLESRPFLTNIEKLCIIHQFLSALQTMHDKKVLHGFLTTENIGLTSWNYVVITDIASYKGQVALPDDDPSDYLYFFQEEAQHDNNTQRGKRCYLAPERFYSPKSENPPAIALTEAMDVFSAGCILLETWLNGERALDLGDTMDYRSCQEPPPSLVQKFSKVDSSHLRAACRHMMSLDPQQRLCPLEYLHRLQMPAIIGDVFEPLLGRILNMAPDARIAVAASVYAQVLRKTHGLRDEKATAYFAKIIGPTMWQKENPLETTFSNEMVSSSTNLEDLEFDSLLKETEELLRRLDNLEPSEIDQFQPSSKSYPEENKADRKQINDENPSETSPECLLIFTQVILANLRHVNKPSTKIVALQLIQRISCHSSDETRLQRLVPSTVFHLQDQDPLVRAMALYTLTNALSQVQSFPPSDSKLFPQYIFKRIAHLLTDPSLVVRVAFSRCISDLAETSRRFLDIIHAVRLYEVIGGGSNNDSVCANRDPDLFGEHIVRLLDGAPSKENCDVKEDNKLQQLISNKNKNLIVNLYDEELVALQDIVSRWIVHIATSEQSSAPKQALLKDLARLCSFFGRERVMEFILPQMLSFLNDRRDWQLRSSLLDYLAAPCSMIGRAATEHFVLPCLESALFDVEDKVICSAVACLTTLVNAGLLSRSVLIDTTRLSSRNENNGRRACLMEKYCPLLLFPVKLIRMRAISFVNSCCKAVGSPDMLVFMVPILRPYLRFEPSVLNLTTPDGLEKCLLSPWTTEGLAIALSKKNVADLAVQHGTDNVPGINDYLIALSRSRSIQASRPAEKMTLSASIEGSLKLSQKVSFQSQLASSLQSLNLPSWYDTARKTANKASSSSEYTSIQSVDELHQVYGLNLYPISDDNPILPRAKGSMETSDVDEQEILQRMNTNTSQQIDAVLRGEWGCECVIDPSLQTTVSLVGKLKSLDVPPLPQNFGVAFENEETKEVVFKGMGDWRPKIEGLVASSSPVQGHSGAVPRLAVSQDQHFFVSCSFDSTCKVWELGKVANSNGVLESSNTYSGHLDSESGLPVRVNDIVILEGSHSVASASSDGRIHIWKVDLVTSSLPPAQIAAGVKVNNFSRVSGSSFIREIDHKEEGEIMAVSHFNTLSESVVAFATQRGYVHSWDLRCEREPFQLSHDAEMGYLTSMAFGSDRNWVVCGTSKGYVALWDIRFQRNVKLWQHSGGQAINRLAASYAPIPGAGINSNSRPLAFVTSGGECGMFDLLDGACRQCFRTDYSMSALGPGKASTVISQLHEIDTSGGKLTSLLRRNSEHRGSESRRGMIPTMNAMVGSMGGNDQNYLITGGGDAQIRYWDFASPLKCYTISGQVGLKYRPIFEVKNRNGCRLMVCKESPEPRHHNFESSKLPRISKRGLGGIESRHQDAILDLKLIQSPIKAILSCSRDGCIKIFQ